MARFNAYTALVEGVTNKDYKYADERKSRMAIINSKAETAKTKLTTFYNHYKDVIGKSNNGRDARQKLIDKVDDYFNTSSTKLEKNSADGASEATFNAFKIRCERALKIKPGSPDSLLGNDK